MNLSPVARLVMETGILAALLTGAVWVATISFKAEAQAADIQELKVEQKVLAKDLVETQKAMLKDITEIKTILKQKH